MALSAEFIYFAARLARLARQWMKERGMIVCTLIVGFIYLVARLARLARQWMKERGMIVCTLIVGFIYLVARLARLARQWIERGIIDMRVKANEPNEPARLVHG